MNVETRIKLEKENIELRYENEQLKMKVECQQHLRENMLNQGKRLFQENERLRDNISILRNQMIGNTQFNKGLEELVGKTIKNVNFTLESLLFFDTNEGPRFFIYNAHENAFSFLPMHDPEWVNKKIKDLQAFKMST